MKKNEKRQISVLIALIDEFIKNKEAISSGFLCKKYFSSNSSATIRIDLVKLEEKGYIYQPHTSSGRVPTVLGYKKYLKEIKFNTLKYDKQNVLKKIIADNFRDTSQALHFLMKILASETDQLSFIAEPEISYGFLSKLEVFKIAKNKLLFVVCLDSGIEKTVIINCKHNISENQLKVLVKYVNDKFIGLRIYDIQNKYLEESKSKNDLLSLFLKELYLALQEMSGYFIHFDGNISFLKQPEFDSKETILSFFQHYAKTRYSDKSYARQHRKQRLCNITGRRTRRETGMGNVFFDFCKI